MLRPEICETGSENLVNVPRFLGGLANDCDTPRISRAPPRSPDNANRLAARACFEMEREGLYGLGVRPLVARPPRHGERPDEVSVVDVPQ